MPWVVLILSGAFEAVWAVALGKTEGFTRLWPSLIFFGALAVSMGGLGWAMKYLPTGTSYAVWAGMGASVAVVYSMATGAEPITVIRVVLLAALIGCIIGLQMVS